MKKVAPALFLCLFFAFSCTFKSKSTTVASAPQVLVFYKTAGYYHKSIPAGLVALQKLGLENGFTVDTTNNALLFTPGQLKKYRAVVFLNTTSNILNPEQKQSFEQYIKGGGGFVGVHAATDTEYEWPWYNQLVGAQFMSHPKVQAATLLIQDKTHPATSFLPDQWKRTDEWYNFKNLNPNMNVLATLDETSYTGGKNGKHHPASWYHAFDGGRAFYTVGGHSKESYSEPLFLRHLLGGIQYAMGLK